MTKKSAFERTFCEVLVFDNCGWVLSKLQYPTKEEAIIIYQKEVHEWGRDQIVTSEDISEDWVRFYRGESDGEVVNAWWLDQKGKKRAKPVWIFTPLKQQRI